MKIQEFINKAIEGGWLLDGLDEKLKRNWHWGIEDSGLVWRTDGYRKNISDGVAMFLDPKAWEAFYYAMGWDVKEGTMRCEYYNPKYNEPGERGCNKDKCTYVGWRDYRDGMHQMIDALVEGKSLEEFIATL